MNREVSRPSVFAARILLHRFLSVLALLCARVSPRFRFTRRCLRNRTNCSIACTHRRISRSSTSARRAGWTMARSTPPSNRPPAVKDAQDIVRYETATGKREVLVSAAKLIPAGEKVPLAFENYAWSKDKSRLLLYTNSAQVWRLRTRGDYWVLDLQSGTLRKLGGDAPASSLMFAKFSPDGSKVAYVRGNNIYVEEISTGRITQLTHDGSQTIINGTSDWVYEEELDVRDAFRWSPDGRRIAYWQFDTSGVGIFKLLYNLGAPKEIVTGFPYPGLGPYPSVLNIPYPIPGTTNSAVRAGVVSVDGGETQWMQVPGDPRDNYIARLEWAGNSSELAIEHLNRLQNTNDVLLADASTGAVRQIFRDQDSAWVDVMDEIHWVHNGQDFLWLSERDGWRHAYLVSRDGKRVQLITPGAYDVIELGSVDEKAGWLYFTASPENATQRYLYRAPWMVRKTCSASVLLLHPEVIVTICLPMRIGLFTFIRAPTSHR